MTTKEPSPSEWQVIEEPKVLPHGWDLSSMPAKAQPNENEPGSKTAAQAQPAPQPDPGARARTEWQMDPYFDRISAPSRRDLSAY